MALPLMFSAVNRINWPKETSYYTGSFSPRSHRVKEFAQRAVGLQRVIR